MCESSAYVLEDGEERLVFEDVDTLESIEGQVKMTSVFGEQKSIKAKVKVLSLIDHKIILEPI